MEPVLKVYQTAVKDDRVVVTIDDKLLVNIIKTPEGYVVDIYRAIDAELLDTATVWNDELDPACDPDGNISPNGLEIVDVGDPT